MNYDSTPYFATNKKWFYYNPDIFSYYGCLLTEEGKKNPKVVKSYNDFYDPDNLLFYDGAADNPPKDPNAQNAPAPNKT